MSEKTYIPLWLKVCEKDDESLMVEWTYQLCKAVEQERERKEWEKNIKQYNRCPHCNKHIIWYTWPPQEPSQ